MIDAAPWIKVGHIVSVIAWMAGMLYLPRLFVYHCQVDRGSAQSDLFKVMERRLMRAIINPAMIATFVFGILLLGTPGLIEWLEGWIWVKLALVIGLTGCTGCTRAGGATSPATTTATRNGSIGGGTRFRRC